MPHAKAVVAGRTIAETDDYEVVEGNIYVSFETSSSPANHQLTIAVPALVSQELE